MSENSEPRPTIRLKPRADARRLRHGFPWVYADDLVTDRRTRSLAPGTIAVLEDSERRPLGLVAVNPGSRIIARMLDRDSAATIDETWFRARISRALALRNKLYAQPFYRLVHAEADGLPGVVIDRFGDTAVVQPNAAWSEDHLDALADALIAETGLVHVWKNASGRARNLEGLDDASAALRGTPPETVLVPMNGATYVAAVQGGQKTGLFYDQRDNQAFAAKLAQGARVLDVFCHVGGFGMAALAGGATSAHLVDGAQPALDLARQGAAASGLEDRVETLRSDAFDALSTLNSDGARFDLVVCDPPAFAPSKQALDAGLRAYEKVARLGAGVTAPGGYLVLCSCSHAATPEKFRAACLRGIGRAGRVGQLIHTGQAGPDHPQHPYLAESGYLKALFFRLDG